MDDTIDVEATPIDQELSTLSRAELWLASASERVSERCELYRPPEQLVTETDYRNAKSARAQCRRDRDEIDAERKALLREMEDKLKSFKSSVKDVLSPLTDLDEKYKALITEYENSWKVNRQIELSTEYEDIAPMLVEVVPFELIMSVYGRTWLNRTTNIEAAKNSLADAVYDIAEGEKAIDSLVGEDDREAIKARYFQTLDLQGALSESRRLKEQRERVRRLEAERAAIIQMQPAPVVENVPAKPEPTPEAPTAHPWVISIPSATHEQMESVAAWMRSNGIVFDRIYAGTIQDICRREG